MFSDLRIVRTFMLAVLCLLGPSAQAAVTIFTTQSSFLAAIQANQLFSFSDSFNDLVVGTGYTGVQSRNAVGSSGPFAYQVQAGPASNVLYGAGANTDAWLSSDVFSDSITFGNFGPVGVTGIGAFVFGSDTDGALERRATMTVVVTDGSGTTTRTLTRTDNTTFIGFISDSFITSMVVSATSTRARNIWPTVNNLSLASPVPEPSTIALWLSGLAVVGFLARRRRA